MTPARDSQQSGFFRPGKPEGEIEMKIDETLEMAYPQKLARDIVVGIADPVNEHLVKLIAFQFDPRLRHHFRAAGSTNSKNPAEAECLNRVFQILL
jgi:hypothetical protein